MSWLTGNLVIDLAAIIGAAFLVLVFGGFAVWALWDRLRPSRGEHHQAIGEEVTPAVVAEAEPVVKKRSPFAPTKRTGAAK